MRLLGLGSSDISSSRRMAAVMALVSASGCVGADAAIVDGECNQTDSTVSCSRGPHLLINVSDDDDDDDAMSDEEVDKMCREYYVRCTEKRGLKINLQYGTSRCQSCFDLCSKKRYWPWSANSKRCPGG